MKSQLNRDVAALVPNAKVNWAKERRFLALTMLCSIIAVFFLFQLWSFHPFIPISYDGDGLLTLNGLRNIQLHGWYFSTPNLGAPFGQNLHDFPAVADNLHLLLLWFGIKLFRNEFLVFNLYFLGAYVLSSVFGYIGSRMLRIAPPAAVLIGVAYAFINQQGPGHLYLSAYWAVPLWVAFLIRELSHDSLILIFPDSCRPRSLARWACTPRALLITLISLLAATTGLYYAFFFLSLAFFVSIIKKVSQKNPFQWLPAAWAFIVGVFVLAVQYFPIWLYQQRSPNDLAIIGRTVAAVEFYSLKLVNLILPDYGHRLHFFAQLRNRSNPVYLIGENTDAIGLLASIGFIALLVISVHRIVQPKTDTTSALASFNLIAILISMTGGLAQLMAVFGFTELRVWSRISVVLAFPALIFVVGLIYKKIEHLGSLVAGITLTLIGVTSILDTNPTDLSIKLRPLAAQAWESDRELVHNIEEKFGNDAQIFQLPIAPFPEYGSIVSMPDYSHLRGYMHSNTLRWSYGAVKGRNSDWMLSLPTDPNQLVESLRTKNFKAIWLNTLGYEDSGLSVIADLERAGLTIAFQAERIVVLTLSQ